MLKYLKCSMVCHLIIIIWLRSNLKRYNLIENSVFTFPFLTVMYYPIFSIKHWTLNKRQVKKKPGLLGRVLNNPPPPAFIRDPDIYLRSWCLFEMGILDQDYAS